MVGSLIRVVDGWRLSPLLKGDDDIVVLLLSVSISCSTVTQEEESGMTLVLRSGFRLI